MVSPAPAPRWRTVRVGNASVALMEVGEGEPLLFLHGWGLTPRTYGDALSRLCAGGVRVIAPALPGFGASSPLPLRSGLADHADLIARLLDVLDLPKAVFVVGHSLGGGIGIKLAHARPDLVRSLTLVNTVGGRPTGSGRLVGGGLDWLRWTVGAVTELDPREWLAPHIAPQILRDLVGNFLRHPARTIGTGVMGIVSSLGVEAGDLVSSGLPVLFVWGDRDRLTTPGVLAGVPGRLGSEVVAGRHGWMLTEPAEFAGVMRDALVVHAMMERTLRGKDDAPDPAARLGEIFPVERRKRERWQVDTTVRERGVEL